MNTTFCPPVNFGRITITDKQLPTNVFIFPGSKKDEMRKIATEIKSCWADVILFNDKKSTSAPSLICIYNRSTHIEDAPYPISERQLKVSGNALGVIELLKKIREPNDQIRYETDTNQEQELLEQLQSQFPKLSFEIDPE